MRLRVGEAAQRLGLSPDTIREWVRRGFLNATRTPTGQLLFDEGDVEAARRGDGSARSPAEGRDEHATEQKEVAKPAAEVPSWKKLPPWVAKVEAARASLTLEELESERREKAIEREMQRQQTLSRERKANHAAAERQRLIRLKQRVIQSVWIPSQFRSQVVKSVETFATPEQLPAWLPEWEQFQLVASHTRDLVQRLLSAEQKALLEENERESRRRNEAAQRQAQAFAEKLAEALEDKQAPRVRTHRTVAEALRDRGITES